MRTRTLSLLAVLGAAAAPAVAAAPAASAAEVRPAFVFHDDRDGDDEIYVRRTDGSVGKLTSNTVHDGSPVYSPDGSRIAFVRDTPYGSKVFVMDADGSDVRQLTRATAGRRSVDLSPAWSPDGTRVTFSSDRGGPAGLIYRIDADGTDLVRLTSDVGQFSDENPAWSADGWIWFDSDRADYANREIYRMRPDGSRVQRMTRTASGVEDREPDVSPDGRRVVFSSTRGNGDHDLISMRRDGTDVRRLGSGTEIREQVVPRWTADGASVLYWSYGTSADPRTGIWQIDADGTDDRRITVGGIFSAADPYPVPGV